MDTQVDARGGRGGGGGGGGGNLGTRARGLEDTAKRRAGGRRDGGKDREACNREHLIVGDELSLHKPSFEIVLPFRSAQQTNHIERSSFLLIITFGCSL